MNMNKLEIEILLLQGRTQDFGFGAVGGLIRSTNFTGSVLTKLSWGGGDNPITAPPCGCLSPLGMKTHFHSIKLNANLTYFICVTLKSYV